jgi:PRTase ComF-like
VEQLNLYLYLQGLPSLQESKIHRSVTYREDYGAMSAADRLKLIQNDAFHTDSSFLSGKTLIFLDDIRITGTHERIITKLLDESDIQNDCFFLYFAAVTNPAIDPTIENYLNYYEVTSITELESIIQGGHFSFNSRVVKYLLNGNSEVFSAFLERQTEDFRKALLFQAIGNAYHTIPGYKKNLSILANTVIFTP